MTVFQTKKTFEMNLVHIIKKKTLSLSQVLSSYFTFVSIKQEKDEDLREDLGLFTRGTISVDCLGLELTWTGCLSWGEGKRVHTRVLLS